MEVVHRAAPLSMSWCLECHRNPDMALRPVDQITNMAYDQRTALSADQRQALKDRYHINPSEACSTCHR